MPVTAELPPAPDFVVIGRVRRPHGVSGAVAVEVLTDRPERFAAGNSLFVVTADGQRRRLALVTSRRHPRGVLLTFEGIDDRDAADALRGAQLEVAGDEVGEAPAGAYYYYQLAGCTCHDRQHGELGRVREVLEDGGGLLLDIAAADRRLLVPFVKRYLVRVDVASRTIELDLPDGLIETCASRF